MLWTAYLCGYCKVLPSKDHATCGKEIFTRNHTTGLSLFQIQSEAAWLNWVVDFIGGAKPWGREREYPLWLSVTIRWNRWTFLARLSNWKFLSCFASRKTIRQGETSGHKSGGLVLVLASGPSVHPKNARDLTVIWQRIVTSSCCENILAHRHQEYGKQPHSFKKLNSSNDHLSLGESLWPQVGLKCGSHIGFSLVKPEQRLAQILNPWKLCGHKCVLF
jgi:hypothetical protein